MLNFIWGLLTGIIVSTIVCLIWQKMKKTEEPIQTSEIESANPNPNVEIKKENFAASSLLSPVKSPAEIVIPLLEIPGKRAKT